MTRPADRATPEAAASDTAPGTGAERAPGSRAADTGIGARIPRREDERLLRGRGRFTDDVNRARQAYLRLVRSNSAHGRIARIDVEQARRLPGCST